MRLAVTATLLLLVLPGFAQRHDPPPPQYGAGGVTMSPAQVVVPVGGTVTVTAAVKYPPNVFTWKISSSYPAVASADGVISPGTDQIALVITGKSLGETDIVYLVSSFGYNPGGLIGSVTVVPPCTKPSLVAAPADRTSAQGLPITLETEVTGTGPFRYDWFARENGPALLLAGHDSTVTTAPLFRTMQFWVEVTGPCGSVASVPATITVAPARGRASRH